MATGTLSFGSGTVPSGGDGPAKNAKYPPEMQFEVGVQFNLPTFVPTCDNYDFLNYSDTHSTYSPGQSVKFYGNNNLGNVVVQNLNVNWKLKSTSSSGNTGTTTTTPSTPSVPSTTPTVQEAHVTGSSKPFDVQNEWKQDEVSRQTVPKKPNNEQISVSSIEITDIKPVIVSRHAKSGYNSLSITFRASLSNISSKKSSDTLEIRAGLINTKTGTRGSLVLAKTYSSSEISASMNKTFTFNFISYSGWSSLGLTNHSYNEFDVYIDAKYKGTQEMETIITYNVYEYTPSVTLPPSYEDTNP